MGSGLRAGFRRAVWGGERCASDGAGEIQEI